MVHGLKVEIDCADKDVSARDRQIIRALLASHFSQIITAVIAMNPGGMIDERDFARAGEETNDFASVYFPDLQIKVSHEMVSQTAV